MCVRRWVGMNDPLNTAGCVLLTAQPSTTPHVYTGTQLTHLLVALAVASIFVEYVRSASFNLRLKDSKPQLLSLD